MLCLLSVVAERLAVVDVAAVLYYAQSRAVLIDFVVIAIARYPLLLRVLLQLSAATA
jgi:hypothetical protein